MHEDPVINKMLYLFFFFFIYSVYSSIYFSLLICNFQEKNEKNMIRIVGEIDGDIF